MHKQWKVANKKLLILIEWFAPGYKAGGPIQSCVNLCIALQESYDIYVLTTDTDHGESLPYAGVATNAWIREQHTGAMVYYAKKKALSFTQLANEIAFINADFVYLNLLFSPAFALYPLWLKLRHTIRGKVVLCPRGTLYDSALSLKGYKKKPLLLLLKWAGIAKQITFHATNLREQAAIEKYFPNAAVLIANNLPGVMQSAFSSCVKEAGTLRCIFIARIVPIKNILFLLQLLQKMHADILLTIVGPVEDETYWKECESTIQKLPANIQVNYVGAKQNTALPGLLLQHHLFVLPTTGENFGHAIFEAFLAGRPVLISDQTPWQKLADNKAGWELPLAAPEGFAAVLEQAAGWDQAAFDGFAQAAWHYAHAFINNPLLTKPYHQLFA